MISQRGFTLLEVIIAVTIMAFISIFTAQSIQTALKQKSKYSHKLEDNSQLRDVLFVMQSDIQKAYHYYDYHAELYNLAQEERQKRKKKKTPNANPANPANPGTTNPATPNPPQNTSNPSTPPQPIKKKEAKNLTQFIGAEEKLNFTTLNNSRTRTQKSYSDQAEVGYFLKTCSERGEPDKKSNCLWRRVSPIIDEDITTGGDESVLIENVEELKFRYTGPETNNEWQNQWRTDQQEYAELYHHFPSAVEITLSIKDPQAKGDNKDKPLSMSLVAPIRFPNNQDKKASSSSLPNEPASSTNSTTPGSNPTTGGSGTGGSTGAGAGGNGQ